jgi:hypothetical protein
MWMIKSKFSEHIRSKTDTAIINELLCKVLCHNIYVVIQFMYELGIGPTFCAKPVQGFVPFSRHGHTRFHVPGCWYMS